MAPISVANATDHRIDDGPPVSRGRYAHHHQHLRGHGTPVSTSRKRQSDSSDDRYPRATKERRSRYDSVSGSRASSRSREHDYSARGGRSHSGSGAWQPPRDQHQHSTGHRDSDLSGTIRGNAPRYPREWLRLPVPQHFLVLQRERAPSSRLVVDWCDRMLDILTDQSRQREINQITIARCFTLLGQKAKNREIKKALRDYFVQRPKFLTQLYSVALFHLQARDSRTQFNQQALANVFYGHAQLGQRMPEDFVAAWYAAALRCLQARDPRTQFNQQALSNIFYGHAQLGMGMPEDFVDAWYAAALRCLQATDPSTQFNQQELSNIFYGHAQLGQ